jgi:acyl-CoA synthetase (AMP-forming)/AMP-acid ligase II
MISDHLRSVARRFPGELAIVDGGQRISFGELLERVLVARDWLRKSLDPKPGDVIAVALDNSWQFAACLFAVSELGCALLPCNPQWRAAELRAVAGRLGFRGAVVEPRLTAEWNQILDIVPNACVLSVESMPAGTISPLPVPLQLIPWLTTLRRFICRLPDPLVCLAWSPAAIAI